MLTTTTTRKLEELPVELFYEIFLYFHFDEVLGMFFNLNSRLNAILNQMTLPAIALGRTGMSLALVQFYSDYLLQRHASVRLLALRVSDERSLGNGLWLAQHLTQFLHLRSLSLIDIKRPALENLLNNSSSPLSSLREFRLKFSNYCRAAYTYEDVPEGAYYERIFQLFPSLRRCELAFRRGSYENLLEEMPLPSNQVFLSTTSTVRLLKSLILEDCSFAFVRHLIGNHSQLEELQLTLTKPWLPSEHPLLHLPNEAMEPIGKDLLPNLRRLKLSSRNGSSPAEFSEQIFTRDVWFGLRKLTLVRMLAGAEQIQKLLAMLHPQCSYTFDLHCFVQNLTSPPDASRILLQTLKQLKGRESVHLELSLKDDGYYIRAGTLPTVNESLNVFPHLNARVVRAQSRWPTEIPALKRGAEYTDGVSVSFWQCSNREAFLSHPSTNSFLEKITSFYLTDPFDLGVVRLILSPMISLRYLRVHFQFAYRLSDQCRNEQVMNFFRDTSLCRILTSNRLERLNLFFSISSGLNQAHIASLIVNGLPNLQSIEFNCTENDVLQTFLRFLNARSNLTFVTCYTHLMSTNEQHSLVNDLQKSTTRPYRVECANGSDRRTSFYLWL